MAKRGRQPKNALESTAVTIGQILGGLSHRVESWNAERHRLIAEIQSVASSMLHQLGEAGQSLAAAVVHTGRRPGFTMSAEARAKIAAAQKARWAKRSGGKKTRNVSPEVRAKLAALAKERWARAKKAGKTRLG